MGWRDYVPEAEAVQGVFTDGLSSYVDAEIKRHADVEDPEPKVESLPGEQPKPVGVTAAGFGSNWKMWAGIAAAVVVGALVLRR